ncbi:MAG: hypothetical protein Q7S19_02905 [bacterium]|nr:hypothetical protein [bacterium]
MHRIGIDLSNADARFAWRNESKKADTIYFASTASETIESIVERILKDTGKTVAFVIGVNAEIERQLEALILVKFHGNQTERIAQTRIDGWRKLKEAPVILMIDYAGAMGVLFYGR